MRDKRVYAAVAAVAVLGVPVGSFLPWVRLTGPFGEFTKRGLEDDSDGIITLALGLVAVWAVAYYYFGQGKALLGSASLALISAAVVAVAVVDLADTRDRAAGVLDDLETLATASSGDEAAPVSFVAAEGLYMVLISGIALFLAAAASAAASLLPVESEATASLAEVEPAAPPDELAPAEESPPEPMVEAEPQPPEPALEGEATQEEG